MTQTVGRFASSIDAWQHGIYRIPRPAPNRRPTPRFTARVAVDVPVESGRYHLYGGWFCPWSHRAAIHRELAGITEHVSMSYVDGLRDGRGWAFREATGADPVNGFTLIRQAYEATEPGYRGHVSVPVLWDRVAGRIVSNDPVALGLDLATAFGPLAAPVIDVYPLSQRAAIEDLDRSLRSAITYGIGQAAVDPGAGERLVEALRGLDARLQGSTFLLGDQLTDADIRLWVTLVRYDSGPNAHRNIGPRLATFPQLWDWARALYAVDAFRLTTDFRAFSAPLAAVPDWELSAQRRVTLPVHVGERS